MYFYLQEAQMNWSQYVIAASSFILMNSKSKDAEILQYIP